MIDKTKLELFGELFDRSESILIICGNTVSRDQLLAATALYGAIKLENKKQVKILCSKKFSKQEKKLAYVGEIQDEIGHENLCISLDYIEDSVDKVSYHVDEDTQKFYLTIKPKKGEQPLSDRNVDFSYTGADADMIVLVGVDELDSLGTLYFGYENLFNSAALVSINSYETEFGNLKFDVSEISSFSEFVSQLFFDLKIEVDPESATNLLSGIHKETNSLSSYSATADTFEVISRLIRAGARRSFGKTNDSGSDVVVDEAGEDVVSEEIVVKSEEKSTHTERQVSKSKKQNQKKNGKKKNWKKNKPPGGKKFN